MARALSGILMGGAALLAAAPAFAQTVQQDAQNAGQGMFERNRNVAVSERQHPGYDPLPIRAGGFTVLPKLDAGLEYNDNIYATPSGKNTDTIFTATPEVDLNSNWNRNALQGFVRSASREYTQHDTESTTDYQVGGQGRLDESRGSYLSGGGDTGELTEPRTSPQSPQATTKPVRYQQSDAFVTGVQEVNRFRFTGRFDLANLDYHNGQNRLGGVVLQDDRDRNVYTYTGKAEYAVSPDAAIFIDGSYNDHQYRLQPPTTTLDKNSHGGQFNIGANFDLSHLLRGDIQVGYLKQDFAARTLPSISGLSALGRLEWFPTQLTTVSLSGSRAIQDASAIGSAAYVAGAVNAEVDHELLRNLILIGRVGYENDDYKGVTRTDKQTSAYVGAKYLVNRVVGITVGYTYLNLQSAGAASVPTYTVNRIMASLNFAF